MALLILVFNILLMAINIAQFFLLVNVIMTYKDIQWLKPFDTAGKDIVNGLKKILPKITDNEITTKTKVFIWITILEFLRLLIAFIFVNR